MQIRFVRRQYKYTQWNDRLDALEDTYSPERNILQFKNDYGYWEDVPTAEEKEIISR